MRIVHWNCKEGLSRAEKVSFLTQFNADIAVIPEIRRGDIDPLKPNDFIWVTNNHTHKNPKGLGVLAFNGATLKPLRRDDEMEIYLPLEISFRAHHFNLLAVWNFYSASKQGRFRGVTGDGAVEYSAIREYRILAEKPTLVVGDWNLGPTFAVKSYEKIKALLMESEIHCLFEAQQAHDPRQYPYTFRANRGGKFHSLDHAFGTPYFCRRLTKFEVSDIALRTYSDHAAILLEFSEKENESRKQSSAKSA